MDLDKIINVNNNLFKRILSIIVLFPIYFYSIISDNFLAILIILITSLLLSFEWFSITQKSIKTSNIFLFTILIIINIFFSNKFNLFFSIILTIFLSTLFLPKLLYKNHSYKNSSWLFYGFIFISIPLIFFLKIKELENGSYLLLWTFLVICTTDIFSYLFGNLIKGPKIFPKLSPSKTYSGTFLGLLSGTLIGFLFSYKYLNLIDLYSLFFLSLIISLFGLLGDLLISKVKRIFNVKDSGNFLPGHGGFLDRYDSISFGLIIVFFIQYFL